MQLKFTKPHIPKIERGGGGGLGGTAVEMDRPVTYIGCVHSSAIGYR